MSQIEHALRQEPWQQRLASIMETMREMSRQTDPQEMVRAYVRRVRRIWPADRNISLSRRDLERPRVRVTRYSGWTRDVNPWKEQDRLPILDGGLLSDLIYADEPAIIDELHVEARDPAAEFVAGQRSLMAIPLLDQGVSLNMVVLTREQPAAFRRDELPETVWLANLFGRATHNLVLADQVKEAYAEVDRELKMVADIQRALLPQKMPSIPTLQLAAYYETSRRAGGDYYDFFPLTDGRWGMLIADASGHGTPAAVMMAITHSIAHTLPGPPTPPSHLLTFLNRKLSEHYTTGFGAFVTAFYGIYDPRTHELVYASAGHNPPRLKRCGESRVLAIGEAHGLPLGIAREEQYHDGTSHLRPGDQVIFYTDGITEATSPTGEMFETTRLDGLFGTCGDDPEKTLARILENLNAFTNGRPASDDRTLLLARVVE
jgi:sigma-B regulation protein RsbU (phosphoserine phosphatase)